MDQPAPRDPRGGSRAYAYLLLLRKGSDYGPERHNPVWGRTERIGGPVVAGLVSLGLFFLWSLALKAVARSRWLGALTPPPVPSVSLFMAV